MSVDISDVRSIVEIYRCKSIRRAASVLKIRQSTLSRRLKYVEDELGVTLYERRNSGVIPTDVGCKFVKCSIKLLDDINLFFSKLKMISNCESGCLTIGVYTSFSSGKFREILMAYRREFPMIDIHTVDGGRNELLSDLRTGIIDVAIVTEEGDFWEEGKLPLWSEKIIVAIHEDSALVDRRILYWNLLENESFVLSQRNACSEFVGIMRAMLPSVKEVKITYHDVALDRLLSLVGAGFGISLMAEGAAGASYNGVVYREVHGDFGPVRLNFVACWKHANTNPTLKNLILLLRELYPEFSASDAPLS